MLPVRYRVSGRLNHTVWRAPLPQRLQTWLSHWVYRSPPMHADRVLEILETLSEADVDAAVSGGWGVSALAGRQLRKHYDLDLVIGQADEPAALAALSQLGYVTGYRTESDIPLFARVVLRDHEVHGHVVDLHPVPSAHDGFEFSTGVIDGHEVRCLSVAEQLAAHDGYRRRRRDRLDLRVLRRLVKGSASTLIVPIPDLEHCLGPSARDPGMPAHVTILYPFLRSHSISASTERELSELIAQQPAFDFQLARIDRMPGVVYLAPEPETPFTELVEAITAKWPENPPYEGKFAEVIPHVTIAYGDEPEVDIAAELPLTARAEEVWLMTKRGTGWVRRQAFPLG